MRDREEGRPPNLRRAADEEDFEGNQESAAMEAQPWETLREGYSWVRALELRYPGWRVPAVDGFPFTLPSARLSDSTVVLITLGGVYARGQKPFNTSPGPVSPELRTMRFREPGDPSFREIPDDVDPSDLSIAHGHYDHSEADEDINCVFPIVRLREMEIEGIIGACAKLHYSMMGFSPDPGPLVRAAGRDIIPALRQAGVNAALVSGGCDLSHISAALIQRELEAAGIPTTGVSVCPDITYQMQVPRAASLRFPLGNPFGASMDASMQARILKDVLSLLDSARTPGEVLQLPYPWGRA